MSQLIGACVFGQSGGPTSVINASFYGAVKAALDSESITKVYGAAHGIQGILNDVLYDMGEEDPKELKRLLNTPSSALGSCRYKLADPDKDDKDFKRILEIFQKYDIRYFFYNGGNDSMDTCEKVSRYMSRAGWECRVMGIPKTIDNDLFGTDHCPGYASAAKYIATSCMEVVRQRQRKVDDLGAVLAVIAKALASMDPKTPESTDKSAADDELKTAASQAAAYGLSLPLTDGNKITRGNAMKAQNDIQYALDVENNQLQQDTVSLQSLLTKRDNSFSNASKIVQKALNASASAISNIG